jgi:hypothetical protein
MFFAGAGAIFFTGAIPAKTGFAQKKGIYFVFFTLIVHIQRFLDDIRLGPALDSGKGKKFIPRIRRKPGSSYLVVHKPSCITVYNTN